jgi:hypothetical protein
MNLARGQGWPVGVAAIVTAAIAVVAAGCGNLGKAELTRGVNSITALAVQGRLVANGVARDGTKTTYARVMAETLGGEAQHEAEKLADAMPEPGTERERDAAVQIAGELSDLFSELQTFPRDERHGALIQRQMGELEEQSEALSDRLSKGQS